MVDHISGTGPDFLTAAVASTLVALASLALRNFVRFKLTKCADGADYAVNAAVVFALAGMGTSIVAARTGLEAELARNTDADADADRQAYTLLAAALTQVFWVLAVTVGKLAACLACLSLVEGLPLHSWGIRCLFGLIVVINGTTLILQLVACPSVARPWNPPVSRNCNTGLYEGVSRVQAIGAAASDLPLAIFPAVLLQKVKIMPKTRVALSGIMCLGLASTACAMTKCIVGHHSLNNRFSWQTLEQNLGITALNISASCPLASRTCRRLTEFEDSLFLESLSNMKGRTKGPAGAHHAQVMAAKGIHNSQTCRDGGPGWSWWPRRDRAHDDTSSQRGPVGCPLAAIAGDFSSGGENLRILKTVSVSVQVKNDGDRQRDG